MANPTLVDAWSVAMRSKPFDPLAILAVGLLVAACGTTSPTASPTTASAPSASGQAVSTPSPGATLAEGLLLPELSGDLAVGVHDLDPVADGFGVRAWYPAIAGTGTAGAAYATDEQWTDFGARFTNHTAAALERLATRAATDATPASATGPRPVALLMPGWYLPANSLTVLASDLASHGYIVITIDPPAGSELPPGDLELVPRGAARLAAVRAVLETLGDPTLTDQVGEIDASRVAVGGHSFGGLVSFAASTGEPRVAAVFDLDGMLGILPEVEPVTVPALLVAAELGGEFDAGTLQVLRGSQDAVTVGLRRTAHCDFTDLPIILLATETNPADLPIGAECFGPIGTEGPTSTASLVRAFLDSVLGTPSVVPTAASLIEGVPDGYLDPVGLGD
jgi:dienelactone hydrolase